MINQVKSSIGLTSTTALADLVIIDLYGINVPAVYHLSVAPGGNQAFTVQDGQYEQVSYACGASAAGVLQVTRQLKLVFTPCSGRAPNLVLQPSRRFTLQTCRKA